MKVKYKALSDFPKYEIGTNGVVRECETKNIKHQYPLKNGYMVVSIWKCNVEKLLYVHRLLAIAFKPNPKNKKEVNHKDGNKLNNSLSNLQWVTHAENMLHAGIMGLLDKKLSRDDKLRIVKLRNLGMTYKNIAKIFNVLPGTIRAYYLRTKKNTHKRHEYNRYYSSKG